MAEPTTPSPYSTRRPPEDVARVRRRRDRRLWLVLLGVPTLWLSHLQLIYSLALWSHRRGTTWPMHVGPSLSIALGASAGWLAWRTYRRALAADTPELEDVEAERLHFTAHMALWTAALFVLGLVAQWVAVFMIDPKID
ncbi:MAG TPA: hypothetical protein VEA69_17275 [Tepidisphaeraceae bacterium]|nr:hypothetical protein [Tepidisphaeraceae bacterium]